MQHDQRFKILIRAFFADFLRLFFAAWAGRVDLVSITWLDKEVFPDPPEGTRHELDLIAQVPVLEVNGDRTRTILLVHIEIESPDRTTLLKPRLPYYYHFLRDKYQLPVLPIVIYLKVGLDGVGEDRYIEELMGFEINRFQYLYVGLPALDGIEYVQGDNWLGVALAALMRIPEDRIVWLGAEALRRLAGAPLSEQERFLLSECVQSYLPLNETQRQELEQTIQTEPYKEARTMNQTVYEKGLEQGLELGRQKELMELVVSLLSERFGSLSEETRTSIDKLSMEALRQLTHKIAKGASREELGLPE